MIAIGSDHGGFELKVRRALIIQTVQSLYARLFLTVNVNAVYLSAVQV